MLSSEPITARFPVYGLAAPREGGYLQGHVSLPLDLFVPSQVDPAAAPLANGLNQRTKLTPAPNPRGLGN